MFGPVHWLIPSASRKGERSQRRMNSEAPHAPRGVHCTAAARRRLGRPSCSCSSQKARPASASMAEYREVVVVGNGPSGITMSYLLAGNWPYYGASSHHPNPYLHARLQDNRDLSLVEQDLELLSSGLEGRSCNPVSLLLDSLIHPDADLGSDEPSALTWAHDSSRALDHVVIGSGAPGGSWQRMDGGILTISLGSWMELPDLTFKEWDASKPRSPHGSPNCQNRVSVQRVAQYYRDYVDLKGLRPYFRNYAQVQSVRPFGLDPGMVGHESAPGGNLNSDHERLWEVCGVDVETGMSFSYVTPHVVIAAGHYDAPRLLGVPGEDLPFVSHDLGQLEVLLRDTRASISKLAVVGSGLSAADAVIAARFHGVDVCHVFRKKVDDPELVFNQLPRSMYPEYHKVHRMMSAAEHYPGYKVYGNCQVRCIRPDGTIELDSGVEITDVSHVLVLIGAHPNLNFLPCGGRRLGLAPGLPVDCRANPVQIDPYSHETLALKGLYALGPLVGDNFVRFLQGGALAVTAHIWRSVAGST